MSNMNARIFFFNLSLLEYLEAFLSKGLIINLTSDPENTVQLKGNSVGLQNAWFQGGNIGWGGVLAYINSDLLITF